MQHESSFKIELIFALVLIPTIIFVEISVIEKLLLFITLMGVLIAETINSAIERVVDLVTLNHHNMAGRAKDIGSTIVFLSICVCVIVWGFILL